MKKDCRSKSKAEISANVAISAEGARELLDDDEYVL